MNDFESLLLDASRGKLSSLPIPAAEYSVTAPPPQSSSGVTMSNNHDFFRTGSFTQLAMGHPASVSRGSSSSSVDTSLRLPHRLTPLPRPTTQSSTNDDEDSQSDTFCPPQGSYMQQSKAMRRPLTQVVGESPRPHSVPATHVSECLVITEPRPATTGITAEGAALMGDVSAIDAELLEIARLRKARDDEIEKRAQERERRRQLRQQRTDAGMTESQVEGSDVVVVPQPPPPSQQEISQSDVASKIETEMWELARITEEALAVNRELEETAREGVCSQEQQRFRAIVQTAAYELQKLQVLDEAQHQLRLKRIQERASANDKEKSMRERQRCWEVVRDTVFDEENIRTQITATEAQTWDELLGVFFSCLENPLMTLSVEERLVRHEHWCATEHELFCNLQRRELMERSMIHRLRIERCWSTITARDIGPEVQLYSRCARIRQEESGQRRQIMIGKEIAHNVLWELFCESIQPMIARELWRVAVKETNERVQMESDEREAAESVFHGCSKSWELVSRYAVIVRETTARAAKHRESSIRDLIDDELAGRILMQRDERSDFILLEEISRRELDEMKSKARKRAMEEAIRAAEQFRLSELSRREADSTIKRQKEKTEKSATVKKPSPLPKRTMNR